jgi:hypothetical protein
VTFLHPGDEYLAEQHLQDPAYPGGVVHDATAHRVPDLWCHYDVDPDGRVTLRADPARRRPRLAHAPADERYLTMSELYELYDHLAEQGWLTSIDDARAYLARQGDLERDRDVEDRLGRIEDVLDPAVPDRVSTVVPETTPIPHWHWDEPCVVIFTPRAQDPLPRRSPHPTDRIIVADPPEEASG